MCYYVTKCMQPRDFIHSGNNINRTVNEYEVITLKQPKSFIKRN